MKFYLRLIFFIVIALVFKIIFDIPFLPEEVNSLQDALSSNYLIQDAKNLVINMKKVFKARNPKHVLDRLLQFGADINGEKADGSTPLIFSALKGNKEMVMHLLKKGALAESALFHFILIKHNKAVSLLIKCGANANAQDPAGFTALHYALLMSFQEVIDSLSAHGWVFEKSISEVHAIAETIRLVKLLLLHGANPNAEVNGISVLSYALITSNEELIKLLLHHGANPNIRSTDQDGSTPLIKYVLKNDHEMITLLLEKGADVNLQDNNGKTALFYVRDKEIAKLLVDTCTDINFKAHKGYTALHWAAQEKNEDLVQLLLAKGADVTIKNNEGRSALDSVNI